MQQCAWVGLAQRESPCPSGELMWLLTSRFDRPLLDAGYCWLLNGPRQSAANCPHRGRNVSWGRFTASGGLRAGTGIIAGVRSRSTARKCQIRVLQALLGRRRKRKGCLRSTPSRSSLPSLWSPLQARRQSSAALPLQAVMPTFSKAPFSTRL